MMLMPSKHVFCAKNRHWSRLRWDTSRCHRSERDEANALIINTVTSFGPTRPTRPAQKQASCNTSRCPAGEKESVFSTHLLLIGKPWGQLPTLSDLLVFEWDDRDQRDGCFIFNDLRVFRGRDQSGTGGTTLTLDQIKNRVAEERVFKIRLGQKGRFEWED